VPATVFNLQTGYCARRVREHLLEKLANLPRVTSISFTIESAEPDKVQEFTTLFVGKDTTEELQQHIAKTCRANSKLFATNGRHHLVVCLPDQGIRFYHDGTSSCAVESLLDIFSKTRVYT
jgi:hypothetical protein